MSARTNPQPVTAAISKELKHGHTAGPFIRPPFDTLHCSPLGAIPKKDGSHRIILDLSSPHGSAINEGISSLLFSVKYSKFDDAAALVHSLGRVTYMAKLDIKHPFHLCPVHPEDWPHLGYFWANRYFVNVTLPFRSRSSPFLFNQFADALLWILIAVYGIPFVIHYLDDFFFCNVTAPSCQADMDTLKSTFSELGVPLAPDKVVGPVTQLTYLGIEIDSHALCVRLPSDKLFQLQFLLQSWCSRKKCTKRDLLSLIGSLSFACKVVKPGRIFLRRLIDLSTSAFTSSHHT